jgi:hypothetical protein
VEEQRRRQNADGGWLCEGDTAVATKFERCGRNVASSSRTKDLGELTFGGRPLSGKLAAFFNIVSPLYCVILLSSINPL